MEPLRQRAITSELFLVKSYEKGDQKPRWSLRLTDGETHRDFFIDKFKQIQEFKSPKIKGFFNKEIKITVCDARNPEKMYQISLSMKDLAALLGTDEKDIEKAVKENRIVFVDKNAIRLEKNVNFKSEDKIKQLGFLPINNDHLRNNSETGIRALNEMVVRLQSKKDRLGSHEVPSQYCFDARRATSFTLNGKQAPANTDERLAENFQEISRLVGGETHANYVVALLTQGTARNLIAIANEIAKSNGHRPTDNVERGITYSINVKNGEVEITVKLDFVCREAEGEKDTGRRILAKSVIRIPAQDLARLAKEPSGNPFPNMQLTETVSGEMSLENAQRGFEAF